MTYQRHQSEDVALKPAASFTEAQLIEADRELNLRKQQDPYRQEEADRATGMHPRRRQLEAS